MWRDSSRAERLPLVLDEGGEEGRVALLERALDAARGAPLLGLGRHVQHAVNAHHLVARRVGLPKQETKPTQETKRTSLRERDARAEGSRAIAVHDATMQSRSGDATVRPQSRDATVPPQSRMPPCGWDSTRL
eukprot:7037366-Prymnesium_polylepis.1